MTGLQFTWLKRGERGIIARPMLIVEHLTVRVGVRRVLDGIDLTIYAGEHVRITGPNGSGKSTLLNAVAGVGPARIERGRIRCEGIDITNWPAHERARQGIAYMRQVDNIFPALTVGGNLILALGLNGYTQFVAAFPEWTNSLPPNTIAGQLSGGQRKRLAYAMVVLRLGTRIVLLDEPRAGISTDPLASMPAIQNGLILEVEH